MMVFDLVTWKYANFFLITMLYKLSIFKKCTIHKKTMYINNNGTWNLNSTEQNIHVLLYNKSIYTKCTLDREVLGNCLTWFWTLVGEEHFKLRWNRIKHCLVKWRHKRNITKLLMLEPNIFSECNWLDGCQRVFKDSVP